MDSRNGIGDPSGSSSAFSSYRDFAGPSRARSLKGSDRKPYARPYQTSNGVTTPLNQSPSVRRGSGGQQSQQLEDQGHASPSSTLSTPPVAQVSRSGLFSTLTRAISKPLSWLSTSSHLSAQDEHNAILPSSASTGSLFGHSERPSAASRFGRHNDASGMNSRLRRFRTDDFGADIESHETTSSIRTAPPERSSALGLGETLSSSASMSSLAPRSTLRAPHSRSGMLPPMAASPPSSRRSLNVARRDPEMVHDIPPSPPVSSATAAILSHGRQRSLHQLSTLTPSARRAASIAPSESSSARGGVAVNSQAYAYGFGSERRLGGLTKDSLMGRPYYGGSSAVPSSPSLSYFPSQSPFATAAAPETAIRRSGSLSGRSLLGGYAQSETGLGPSAASPSRLLGPGTPSRPGGSVLSSGSRPAMSPAMSRSGSTLGISSRSRPWSSFNVAPPRTRPSDGEEMMKELASTRKFGTPPASAAPSVISSRDTRANTPLSIKLGKRDASDALELGGKFGTFDLQDRGSDVGSASGSARKKQMVWDPELGFISMDDLRAREPPPVVPQNEAERILGVLEGMRTPLGDARKEGSIVTRARSGTSTPSRLTQSISVPLPSPSAARAAQSTPEARKATRASSRLNQSTPAREDEGMRAKLKRTTRTAPATPLTPRRRDRSKRVSGDDEEPEEDNEDERETAGQAEEEPEPSPPRRVTRNMARAKTREEVLSPPPPSRSTKATAKKATTKSVPTPKSPATRTRRAKAASPSPQPPADEEMGAGEVKEARQDDQEEEQSGTQVRDLSRPKSKFQVRTADSSSSSASRARSSLRQGIVKTSRTHGKSGKISAWDSDEDEDDSGGGEMAAVDVGELKKIQLPKDFFPQGFKFNSSDDKQNSAKSAPDPALSAPDTQPFNQKDQGSEASQTSGGSLLGRLGGFAPPPASTTPAKSPPRKAISNFSFLPSTTKTDSAPSTSAFNFASTGPLSERISKQVPAPSNFFATPPTPQTEETALNKAADEGPKKNGGPIPNFFSSAVQPAESGSLALPSSVAAGGETDASPSPIPFSFGAPVNPQPSGDPGASSSSAPPSISKPAEQAKPTVSGFSFGRPADASASSQTSSDAVSKKNIPNFFNAASSTKTDEPSPGTATAPAPFSSALSQVENKEKPAASGGFTFGQPSTTGTNLDTAGKLNASTDPFGGLKGFGSPHTAGASTADTSSVGAKQKRGADDDEGSSADKSEPTSKKSIVFSFGGVPAGPNSTTAATNGGSTGNNGFSWAPPVSTSTATSEPAKSVSPAPFSFGNPASVTSGSGSVAQSASTTGGTTPFGRSTNPASSGGTGFSFGQPSSAPKDTAAPSASQVTPSAGFSFSKASGAPTSSADSTAASGLGASKQAFSFGAPSTPTQQPPVSNGNAPPGSNDMMDDTSPSQTFNASSNHIGQQQSNASGFGGSFGTGKSSGNAGATGSGGFGFGSPAPTSTQGMPTPGFGFGAGASKQPSASTPSFSFGASAAGGTAAAPLIFGPASGPSTPSATPGGFNFGTPSRTAPVSPAPSQTALPGGGSAGATGGGINFNFASSGAPHGGASGTVTPTGNTNTPFTFGTPGGSSSVPQANGNAGGAGMFQFGSSTPAVPSGGTGGGGGSAPFQFGVGGGASAPQPEGGNVPGSPAPPQGQAPSGPVLFNIGAGASPAPGPGGRQLKALPRSRRR